MQGKRRSSKEFIEEALNIHNNIYDYSLVEYINIKTKVNIICPSHGSFFQLPNNHLSGRGCPACYQERNRLTIQEFISKANIIHNNKYDYSYIKDFIVGKKVQIFCPIHMKIFEQLPSIHLYGQGCRDCGYEKLSLILTKSTSSFIKEAIVIHDNKYDYSKTNYVNSSTKVEINCSKHGSFWQLPSSHVNDGNGCPSCAYRISYSETKWLNELNVPDDLEHRQVKFLINDKIIIADGFIPETKTIYEFYGDKWHGNPQIYDPQSLCDIRKIPFGVFYQKTLEREVSIKNAGYKMITIWENDWRNK